MKNKQALVLLFTAHGISGLAQGMTMLSIPWYFVQQDNSSTFNILYAIVTLITLFWGLIAGSIVDRFPRKKVFLYTNLIEGILVGSIALIGFWQGQLPTPLILFVFTVTVFGFHIHYPNLYAFGQEISEPKNYTKITSLIEIVGQSTNALSGLFVALLLAGVNWQWQLPWISFKFNIVIDPWSLHEIFAFDALTYGISLLLILFIKYHPYILHEIERGSLIHRIRSGVNFLKIRPYIFIFGFFSYVIFLIILVKIHALDPIYVDKHLEKGGDVLGFMHFMYALGALSAGVLMNILSKQSMLIKIIILLMLLATLNLLGLALTKSVLILFISSVVMELSNAGIRVARLSLLFKMVPNAIIGRVNSVFSWANIIFRVGFIGLFSMPFFTESAQIRWAYLILALFAGVSTFILFQTRQKIRSIWDKN